jgi:hypothetical protein
VVVLVVVVVVVLVVVVVVEVVLVVVVVAGTKVVISVVVGTKVVVSLVLFSLERTAFVPVPFSNNFESVIMVGSSSLIGVVIAAELISVALAVKISA